MEWNFDALLVVEGMRELLGVLLGLRLNWFRGRFVWVSPRAVRGIPAPDTDGSFPRGFSD
jgi:hypothetical protein